MVNVTRALAEFVVDTKAGDVPRQVHGAGYVMPTHVRAVAHLPGKPDLDATVRVAPQDVRPAVAVEVRDPGARRGELHGPLDWRAPPKGGHHAPGAVHQRDRNLSEGITPE